MTPTQIKQARKALGLSTGGFARALGVDPRTVRRWEDGTKQPPGPVIILLELAGASKWVAQGFTYRANTPPIAPRLPHNANSDPSATTLAETDNGPVRAANSIRSAYRG
jgi:transcriptional regulator with XRE-family HTH domain